MILNCNSCGKKFVVPDNAISATGRTVQCGSCGNKWKQFPTKEIKQTQSIPIPQKKVSKARQVQQKIQNPKKTKKSTVRKAREINLYSPEYLAKKHGIKLNENVQATSKRDKKVSFGFYNSLLLYLIIIIIFSRGLYFFQDFVIQIFPYTEYYIDYFFESIRNMFEIWKNLISYN
tara:strand:- start:638 stop:1162 length:525 start_codon:yes stop_codon:yes gene_type:complete